MFCWGTQFELHRASCFSLNELMCDVNEDLRKELFEEILLGGNFGQCNQENQSNGKPFVKRMTAKSQIVRKAAGKARSGLRLCIVENSFEVLCW